MRKILLAFLVPSLVHLSKIPASFQLASNVHLTCNIFAFINWFSYQRLKLIVPLSPARYLFWKPILNEWLSCGRHWIPIYCSI